MEGLGNRRRALRLGDREPEHRRHPGLADFSDDGGPEGREGGRKHLTTARRWQIRSQLHSRGPIRDARQKDGLLVREVRIEIPLRDSGPCRNLEGTGAGVALLHERLECGTDDAIAHRVIRCQRRITAGKSLQLGHEKTPFTVPNRNRYSKSLWDW